MQVVATPEAQAYIAANGGVAYVHSTRQRCCGGGLTVLVASTVEPPDAASYEPVGGDGVEVRYRLGPSPHRPGQAPSELLLDLRGKRRPRLCAYWDGCVFQV